MFEDNVKAARLSAGLSQEEVAKSLDIAQSVVAQYELGGKVPNLKTGVKLAKLFGTTCEELVNGKEHKK